MISAEHLKSTCRFGQGEATCAYLMLGGGFHCAKGTGVESHIKARLDAGTMNAKGDNCPGWKP